MVVFLAGLSSLTIFVAQRWKPLWLNRSKRLSDFVSKCRTAWHFRPVFTITKLKLIGKVSLDVILNSVNIWAMVLSPFSIILFLIYIEWTMWWDQQGETFLHVGQWGPLVAAALMAVAGIVDHLYGDGKAKTAGHSDVDNQHELPPMSGGQP